MEQRPLKIGQTKSGSGSISFRISLPAKWIKAMELDVNPQAIVSFDGDKIVIEKEKENEIRSNR